MLVSQIDKYNKFMKNTSINNLYNQIPISMHSKSSITADSAEYSSFNNETGHEDEEVVLPPHPRKRDIVWREVTIFFIMHIGAIYGVYLFLMAAKWQTCLFAYLLYLATALSVSAGAHRLWTHKAYKAKLPLRLLLLSFFTMAFQYTLISWVRIHRMHHKYCDTDADPHNSKRGFFFSHIGWMMIKKHPEVSAHRVDMSDLMNDPLLRFQHKNYWYLIIIACFIVPTYIPTLWGEEAKIAFYICVCLRYIFTLHVTALVNSAAHMWGTKPYDKHIGPVETKTVALLAVGEGFHNFHHTFPWDYRIAELGGYSLNFGKLFVDIMSKIGWAYDLKFVPDESIERRVKRTGDGTHPVWGWDDPDLSEEDRTASIISNNYE